jgi:DNA-binding NarL/FixJ family response regulator
MHATGDWTLLAQLCHAPPKPIVVALLEDDGVPTYVRALTPGAAGAVPRNAALDTLREVFEAAVRGNTLLPVGVMRALAQGNGTETAADGPSSDEQGWLRRLAADDSVARLAEQAGYSERMMFRLLRSLYTRLGTANRTEALIRARDKGWI